MGKYCVQSSAYMYNLMNTDPSNCLAPNSYNTWWLCSIDHDEWDWQVLSQLLPLCSQWSIKNNRLQGLMTQQMMWKALIESNRDTKVCCTESITHIARLWRVCLNLSEVDPKVWVVVTELNIDLIFNPLQIILCCKGDTACPSA